MYSKALYPTYDTSERNVYYGTGFVMQLRADAYARRTSN
jgi:hypothetical protein